MARSADRSPFTLDSNLLVYAVDSTAGERHELSARIVLAAAGLECRLTLQSISEFYVVANRKGIVSAGLAAARANDLITTFPTMAASAAAVRAALSHAVAGARVVLGQPVDRDSRRGRVHLGFHRGYARWGRVERGRDP